ncbi:MAG: MraZ protein [Solirubrobacteraceae bacterium]|nr:MraZ protein [Solirubrobacteraceae bacterium]
MAFRGTFDYSLDQKNRLTVPAKFRAALSEGVVLAKGVDPCVELWSPKDFDARMATALEGRNPLARDTRRLSAFFSANSHDAELDSAGRIGMPPFLSDHGALGKDVVVIGAGDHVQVWNRQAWADFNATLAGEVEEITERLGHPA